MYGGLIDANEVNRTFNHLVDLEAKKSNLSAQQLADKVLKYRNKQAVNIIKRVQSKLDIENYVDSLLKRAPLTKPEIDLAKAVYHFDKKTNKGYLPPFQVTEEKKIEPLPVPIIQPEVKAPLPDPINPLPPIPSKIKPYKPTRADILHGPPYIFDNDPRFTSRVPPGNPNSLSREEKRFYDRYRKYVADRNRGDLIEFRWGWPSEGRLNIEYEQALLPSLLRRGFKDLLIKYGSGLDFFSPDQMSDPRSLMLRNAMLAHQSGGQSYTGAGLVGGGLVGGEISYRNLAQGVLRDVQGDVLARRRTLTDKNPIRSYQVKVPGQVRATNPASVAAGIEKIRARALAAGRDPAKQVAAFERMMQPQNRQSALDKRVANYNADSAAIEAAQSQIGKRFTKREASLYRKLLQDERSKDVRASYAARVARPRAALEQKH